jgi:hypothetical protein
MRKGQLTLPLFFRLLGFPQKDGFVRALRHKNDDGHQKSGSRGSYLVGGQVSTCEVLDAFRLQYGNYIELNNYMKCH